MAEGKNKPKDEEPKLQTPLEYLKSRLNHEYVRHQPQHKKPKEKD